MDSILEFDQCEIKQIKKTFKTVEGAHATFMEYAPTLFETCFLMILSSKDGTKVENLTILKEMSEIEDDSIKVQLNTCLDIVLNICSQIIKVNLRGAEEFQTVLDDLGVDTDSQPDILKVF